MRLATLAIALFGVSAAVAASTVSGRGHRASAVSRRQVAQPQCTDARATHAMLMANDFDGLERRLAWHADSARRDPGYEDRYRAAFDVFDVGDPEIGTHLDAWVESNDRSSAAHLARATYRIARASGPHATKPAGEGTSSPAGAMFYWGDLAKSDIEIAYLEDPSNVLIYFHSIGIAMWYGERERQRVLYNQGLAAAPSSLLLRVRYMYASSPHWGGSLDRMSQLVRRAESDASANSRLRVLRGFLPYEDATTLAAHGDYLGAVRLYTEALRFGDYWQFRLDRGEAWYRAKEYQHAVEDFTAALASRPAMVGALVHRAASYDQLAMNGAGGAERDSLVQLARADIECAQALDPTDGQLAEVLASHPALRAR